ncbi:hypothetical protein Peur_064274 [Populus x canadensis]
MLLYRRKSIFERGRPEKPAFLDQGTSCFIISTILSPLSSFEHSSSKSVRVEEDEEKKKISFCREDMARAMHGKYCGRL